VSSYTDWPPEAGRLPVVTNGGRVNLEALALLRPDLVLGWVSGNRTADMARISAGGVPVVATEASRLDDVPRLIRLIGALADTKPAAERAAVEFEGSLKRIRRSTAYRPRVFYEIWDAPLMTVNGSHWVSDLIRHCGAENALMGLPLLAGPVSIEHVLATDPDVILIGSDPASLPRWQARSRLRATAARRVVQIPAEMVQRMGPRALAGLDLLCAALDRVSPGRI